MNIPYKENPSTINREDKVISLQWHPLVSSVIPENLLIGPNVCTLPIDNEFIMSKKYKKVVVPSDWVKNKYKRWIPEEKIFVWPVGIDTDYFDDKSTIEKTIDCLIYYKRRSLEDLTFVTKMLKQYNQTFDIIEYGSYSETDFISKVSKSKYVFMLDNCESQGIAIQEIMSMNVPMFVWDVKYWADRGEEFKTEASSIPYWDERCGEIIYNKEELNNNFNFFREKLANYKPRCYILENLILSKQASEIIKEFDK